MNSEIAKNEVGANIRTHINRLLERTGLTEEEVSIELSMRRTGLSFQRTRMSADRTLMSVMRTSLSLIGFGFTIFQFFRSLRQTDIGAEVIPINAARNFGLSLVFLGVGMLILGIWYHVRFMYELRRERNWMVSQGLVHGDLSYPVSLTLIAATLLFLIGLVAIFGMVTRFGPF